MKIVYCPAVLRSALQAAGADLQVLRSVEKLSGIVSPEDVAFYCHVNLHPEQYLPVSIARSYPTLPAVDKSLMVDSEPSNTIAAILKYLKEWEANDNAPALLLKNVPVRLTCDLMDDALILFSHVPVSADEAAADPLEVQRSLYRRFVQQLCAVLPFEQVAANAAMAGYLKSTQAVLSASTAA